jgi:16S rRNA (uracil1498-N3)-methyltransferase
MRRVFCPTLPGAGQQVEIPEDEATHLVRVLRLGAGDEIEILDGGGRAVKAMIELRGKKAFARSLEGEDDSALRLPAPCEVIPVTLEMAVLKGEAMEWAVEKAVELGIRELAPFISANTVVQTSRKSPEEFRERWQRIADQSLKQCGRLTSLRVHAPVGLEERIARTAGTGKARLWCDEATRDRSKDLGLWLEEHRSPGLPDELRLLVGPEGGWNPKELGLLERESSRVSLGPLVLRAETAVLYGCALLADAYRRQS